MSGVTSTCLFDSRWIMNIRVLVCAFACLASNASAATDIPIAKGTTVHLASANEAKQTLTTKDDFIRRLSPFDRSARLKVGRPVSEEEFLNFVGRSASDWTEKEAQTIRSVLEGIQTRLRDLPISLPATVQLIKTTGAEEGNAAYTRGTAIIIPKAELTKNTKDLEKLVCHELFHVLSRQDPELREQLYAIIGFKECDEIDFPPGLAPRKITNPDAPRNNHFIRLEFAGQQCLAVPVLLSTESTYNVKKGGEFFDYLNFQFLVVEQGPSPKQLRTVYSNSEPKLIEPKGVSGFFEQIGRNTQYIIHPEEILADNFALLILGQEQTPSPEIPRKMKEILLQKRTSDKKPSNQKG